MILPLFLSLIPLAHASLFFSNTTQDTNRTYRAYDLFQRNHLPTIAPIIASVLDLVMTFPCTIQQVTPSTSNQTMLLLMDWTTLTHYGCYSMPEVLAAVEALYGPRAVVGFYGKGSDMYDTTGPVCKTVYTNLQWPSKVLGVAIDPLFVQAYRQLRIQDPEGVIGAVVMPETNVWTDRMQALPVQLLQVMFTAVYAILLALGGALWLRSLYVYGRMRWVNRDPLASLWPRLSGVMAGLSMFALLGWVLYLPYRSYAQPSVFFFYNGIIANVVAYCLMVHRWTTIVLQVRATLLTRILRHAVLVSMVLTTLSYTFLWIVYTGLFSETAAVYIEIINNTVVMPFLAIVSMLFLALATRLLWDVRNKVLPITRDSRLMLRRITLYGLTFLSMFLLYFIFPVVYILGVDYTFSGYLLSEYAGMTLWGIVNALVLYMWANHALAHTTNVGYRESTDNASILTNEEVMELSSVMTRSVAGSVRLSSEATRRADQWNSVLLQGTTHLRSIQAPERVSSPRRHTIVTEKDDAGLDGAFG